MRKLANFFAVFANARSQLRAKTVGMEKITFQLVYVTSTGEYSKRQNREDTAIQQANSRVAVTIRPRRWCSDACRMRSYRAHKRRDKGVVRRPGHRQS